MTEEDRDSMAGFDQAPAIERVRALESWEVEYRRFTELLEERTGRKLEDDVLMGWRMCYVELKPVSIHSTGDPRGDGRADDGPWTHDAGRTWNEDERLTAISRVRLQDLESVGVEYGRFTALFEERTGQKLEDDVLMGWRMCYVELEPVSIHSTGDIDF